MTTTKTMVNVAAVKRNREDSERRANRHQMLRSHEWEMGWDQSDVDESIAIMRADARRLLAIEAWFAAQGLTDAPLSAIPRALHP